MRGKRELSLENFLMFESTLPLGTISRLLLPLKPSRRSVLKRSFIVIGSSSFLTTSRRPKTFSLQNSVKSSGGLPNHNISPTSLKSEIVGLNIPFSRKKVWSSPGRSGQSYLHLRGPWRFLNGGGQHRSWGSHGNGKTLV